MSIIKVERKTTKEINEIGWEIGEAFAAETSGVVTIIPKEHVVKIFQIMTEFYYNLGVLYTTSENEEGFVAFWTRNQKIPVSARIRLVKRMICEVPLRSCLLVAPTGSEQFRKIYRREKDYVTVSMLVVRKVFQGKGVMHLLLETPFSIAEQSRIPCVLDTDTELKVKKYEKCGMRVVGHKRMLKGFSLYTMAYCPESV